MSGLFIFWAPPQGAQHRRPTMADTTNTDTTDASGAASLGEEQAFEAWYKMDCAVAGVGAKLAAKAAWQARAALAAPAAPAVNTERAHVLQLLYAAAAHEEPGDTLGAITAAIQHLQAVQEAEPATHPDDIAVDRFAAAMKDKLAAARAKGRGGWGTAECTQDRLSHMLREHVEKGDPRDVANFCLFLWARGEVIAAAPHAPAAAVASAEDADGVAFRTAARLGLTLRMYGSCAQSSVPGSPSAYEVVTGDDPAAAMREAVARAEAVIAAGGEAQRLRQSPEPATPPTQEAEDAARYRHLIDTLGDQPHGMPTLDAAWDDDIGFWREASFFGLKDKASIDAEIDAARARQEGGA
ncbi:hypothetical protein [Acidovorax phage AP1]|nr:hypothetical protein [Acidovorax phage AP1]